jgi:hypothetical protein
MHRGPRQRVTKSGTNAIHGDCSVVRNQKFNARDFFALKMTVQRNQFGGTIGGLIKKIRSFSRGTRDNDPTDPRNHDLVHSTDVGRRLYAFASPACQNGRVIALRAFVNNTLILTMSPAAVKIAARLPKPLMPAGDSDRQHRSRKRPSNSSPSDYPHQAEHLRRYMLTRIMRFHTTDPSNVLTAGGVGSMISPFTDNRGHTCSVRL